MQACGGQIAGIGGAIPENGPDISLYRAGRFFVGQPLAAG
jgi:hypothetical protein